MKLLNSTIRNILIFATLIILAVTMIWLVRGQAQTLLTTQANSTTNTPSLPISTATNTPPPMVNFDTPIPGPTYTPTPAVVKAAAVHSAVEVTDRQMLSLEQLRPLSASTGEETPTHALFEAVGWTQNGDVVLQEQHLIKLGDSYYPGTLYKVTGTWAVSPQDSKVTPLPNWIPSTPITIMGGIIGPTTDPIWVIFGYNNEGSTTIDWMNIPTWTPVQRQLASEWARKKPVEFAKPQYWQASPDGKAVILRIVTDKIYIFKPGQTEAVILPKNGKVVSAANAQISPNGQWVVYGAQTDNRQIGDEYAQKTKIYEIQVSDLDGSNITIIPLEYQFSDPGGLTWSVDSQFIAFTAQTDQYSEGHIYVTKIDGTAITDITPAHFKSAASLYWSPDGLKLLHTGGNPDDPKTVGYWITTLAKE